MLFTVKSMNGMLIDQKVKSIIIVCSIKVSKIPNERILAQPLLFGAQNKETISIYRIVLYTAFRGYKHIQL